MKKIFLIIYFIISILSCKKDANTLKTFSLEFVKDVEFSIPSNLFNLPRDYKIVNDDTSAFLIYFSQKSLFTYNLKTKQLISQIDFKKQFYSIFIHNKDSIFVLLRNDSLYKDSVLFLINCFGETKRFYNLSKKFRLASNSNFVKNRKMYISSIYFKANMLFLNFQKYVRHKYVNDSSYNSFQIPIIARYDLIADSLEILPIFEIPFLSKRQYQSSYKFFSTLYNNEEIFISLPFTDNIMVFDLKTKQKDTISTKSNFVNDSLIIDLDRIMPLSQYYFELKRITQLNVYTRKCKIDSEREIYTQIILDSNLNKIGEFIIDSVEIENNCIGDKFYLFNKEKTFQKNNTIVFSVYKIKIGKTTIENLRISVDNLQKINKIQDSNCSILLANQNFDLPKLEKYLSQKIKLENYTVIITPLFLGCSPCIDYTLTYFKMNFLAFEKSNIMLIALDNNFKASIAKLKEYSIPVNSPIVIIDSIEKYTIFVKNITMQTLIKVKKGKIVFANSYKPDSLSIMYKLAIEK